MSLFILSFIFQYLIKCQTIFLRHPACHYIKFDFSEGTSQQRAYILRKRTPAIRSRDVTSKLCRYLFGIFSFFAAVNIIAALGREMLHKKQALAYSFNSKSCYSEAE